MMKYLISLILLSFLSMNINCLAIDVSHSGDRITPVAVIHHLSEEIRNLIKGGDAEKGVPVLDPYEFETKHLNVTKEILNADIIINKGKITGLGHFQLISFNFTKSEIAIDLEINIPRLDIHADHYDLLGNIYEVLPLKGQGNVYFEVKNITLWGKVYLKQSADGRSILLDTIHNPQFSIQQIISRTQFDANIDAIISSMVKDLLADYLTRLNSYIAETYKETLIQMLNKTCEKYDTWKLIPVISSNYVTNK